MKIQNLQVYPIKSTRGTAKKEVKVLLSGLEYDRYVAVIDADGKIVTGREHPKLVLIEAGIGTEGLSIRQKDSGTRIFELPKGPGTQEAKLFRNTVRGIPFAKEASEWISDYLKGDYRFLYLGNNLNPVLEKRGGAVGEKKAYSDSSPVHLINLSTMDYLNDKLKSDVSVQNFRPNIIVESGEPFEEDSWSLIEIGGCLFRVHEHTQRCIFTTIDPVNANLDKEGRPLDTLARLRRERGERPTFGVGLVPLNEGTIRSGGKVKVVERRTVVN